jgi:hypothetical protein
MTLHIVTYELQNVKYALHYFSTNGIISDKKTGSKDFIQPPESPALGGLFGSTPFGYAQGKHSPRVGWGTPPKPRQKEFWTSFQGIS